MWKNFISQTYQQKSKIAIMLLTTKEYVIHTWLDLLKHGQRIKLEVHFYDLTSNKSNGR